jgi:UDP-3-O-[3-hydroxymyristoyl] glucosamine N-acyltransferase
MNAAKYCDVPIGSPGERGTTRAHTTIQLASCTPRALVLQFPEPRMPFRHLASRIQPPEGLLKEEWEMHPNGGGWVQKTAFVAKTAYVGPYAIISGEARVLDNARIVDEASITDLALIAGAAVVGGRAAVGGHATIFGSARVLGDAQLGGLFFLSYGEIRGGVSRPMSVWRRRHREPSSQMSLAV